MLPTIRSRCRTLILRPLAAEDVARATAAALGETKISDEIRTAAAAADGSVGRALRLLEGDALELREQMVAVLERLPDLDPRALHALGDEIAGTDAESLAAFMDTVNAWLGDRLKTAPQEARRLAPDRRSLEQREQGRARNRGLQSRSQAFRILRVRTARRSGARLTPAS